MVSLRPLLFLALIAGAYSQTKPDNIRVSTWVREDLFAGYMDNDMARHAIGMKKIDAILAADPNAADAVGWKAASTVFFAIRAYEAGDNQTFEREYAAAQALYTKAAEIAKRVPAYREGILAITGGSFTVFSDRLPAKYRRAGWERVRENYTALRAAQQPAFDKFPPHFKGEIMAGLAQSAQRLGEADKARTLTEELVAALPGTPYGVFGKRWLEKPETMPTSKITCVSCHDAGRLQATLDRTAKN